MKFWLTQRQKIAEKSFIDDINLGMSYERAFSDNEYYKQTLISNMKTYTQQILSDTYTYPKYGEYAESEESAEMMEEEFDKKLEEMNKYLKSL